MARIAVLAGLHHQRGRRHREPFCASGLTAIQMAADRIRVGEADVMIAAGTESMSMVPMGGNKPSFNPEHLCRHENVGIRHCLRHGPDRRKVAQQWKVSREAQDAFALESHQRAMAAQAKASLPTKSAHRDRLERSVNLATGEVVQTRTVNRDEGPPPTPRWEGLAKLAKVLPRGHGVTAGNSSRPATAQAR